MSDITASSVESQFVSEDLFFTRTDLSGRILDCSDSFIQITAHTRESLIGSPHKVIRHPDMPMAIFQLLWDSIKAGKVTSAYVKNRTSRGKYYWVYLTVFPVEQGYLAISFKPIHTHFKLIPEIYSNALDVEKKSGPEASMRLILKALSDQGFASYEKFMIQSLIGELNERRKVVNESDQRKAIAALQGLKHSDHFELTLKRMTQSCTLNIKDTENLFKRLETFDALNKELGSKSGLILQSLKKFDLLAMNMLSASTRAGSEGITLTTVANEMQKHANDVRHNIGGFKTAIEVLQQDAEQTQQQICYSELQTGMLEFLLKEFLASWTGAAEKTAAQIEEMRSNSQPLISLAVSSLVQVKSHMFQLSNHLSQLDRNVRSLETTITGLEMIRKTGTIEAARAVNIGSHFETFFQEMDGVIVATRTQLAKFIEQISLTTLEISGVYSLIDKISRSFNDVGDLNGKLTLDL